MDYANTAGMLRANAIGPASASKPVTELEGHAGHLASTADNLLRANGRLQDLISRIRGPVPLSGEAGGKAPERPSGVLYVAQFESRRISDATAELHKLLDELSALI